MSTSNFEKKRIVERLCTHGAWVIALFAWLTLAQEASAQSKDRAAEAKAQFEAGQAAVEKGDLKGARALFLASRDRLSTAGTLLNLADCEEQLGLVASAWQHFQEAVPLLRVGDSRVVFANERATAVEPRVPKLRIDLAAGAPTGTRVLIDAREVPAASLLADVPLDPGDYTVTVAAPGRVDRNYPVKLAEKQRQTLSVEPGALEAIATLAPTAPTASGSPVATVPVPPPVVESSNVLRNVGFTIGGIGIVGIGIGAVTGGIAVQKKGDLQRLCPIPAQCTMDGQRMAQEGKGLGIAATVGLTVGLPLLAVGVALVVVGRRGVSTVQIAPAPGGGSVVMAETPF